MARRKFNHCGVATHGGLGVTYAVEDGACFLHWPSFLGPRPHSAIVSGALFWLRRPTWAHGATRNRPAHGGVDWSETPPATRTLITATGSRCRLVDHRAVYTFPRLRHQARHAAANSRLVSSSMSE